MKNENKKFVKKLAIFSGVVILAGSSTIVALNAFNTTSSHKGKKVSITAYSDGNVSIDTYELRTRTTYDENGEHREKIYVHTPNVVNVPGGEVITTFSNDNVSIDAYELRTRTTYDENGEHREKIYVHTPVVNTDHVDEVSLTADASWDVSFDDYVLCGNCDHVKKVYVYTPKHRK